MLTITNTGEQPAINFSVNLGNEEEDISGIDPTSVVVDSNGTVVNAFITFTDPLVFQNCGTVTDLYEEISVVIPYLGEGESITLIWEAYVCAVDCDFDLCLASCC